MSKFLFCFRGKKWSQHTLCQWNIIGGYRKKLKHILRDGGEGIKTHCWYVYWQHSTQWTSHRVSEYMRVSERNYKIRKLSPLEKNAHFIKYWTHKRTAFSRGGDVCSSSFSYVCEWQFPLSVHGTTLLISFAFPLPPVFCSFMMCLSLLFNRTALSLSSWLSATHTSVAYSLGKPK
jgi:hypothetical protein